MAGAWFEPPKKKIFIAKDGKKKTTAQWKGMEHKNRDLKGCEYANTWSSNSHKTYKIKQPEGVYQIAIGAGFKSGQKVKGSKKKPIPPTCKIDSAWEFPEITIWISSLKMPTMHTCEVDVCFNRFKNTGSATDFDPWAMFDIDIRTGHMVMGKWAHHPKVCDFFAGKQKIKFN